MSEFVKPKRVTVRPREYLNAILEHGINKDLHDNEELCEHCHGTGVVLRRNPYSLENDPDKKFGDFPYEHQALSFCPMCYNGVVHRCELCGEIMSRGSLKHNCEKQRELDWEEEKRKIKEKFDNAAELSNEEAGKLVYFYSADYPFDDGFFSDWDLFFDEWFDRHSEEDARPEFVWATCAEEMSINAESIIERACEDMYEDAFSNIRTKDIDEMQNYLDKWIQNCGVGPTYYPDTKFKVKIPWERY